MIRYYKVAVYAYFSFRNKIGDPSEKAWILCLDNIFNLLSIILEIRRFAPVGISEFFNEHCNISSRITMMRYSREKKVNTPY